MEQLTVLAHFQNKHLQAQSHHTCTQIRKNRSNINEKKGLSSKCLVIVQLNVAVVQKPGVAMCPTRAFLRQRCTGPQRVIQRIHLLFSFPPPCSESSSSSSLDPQLKLESPTQPGKRVQTFNSYSTRYHTASLQTFYISIPIPETRTYLLLANWQRIQT